MMAHGNRKQLLVWLININGLKQQYMMSANVR